MLRLTALEAFRREHRGPVLVAGDDAYERARTSFNALVDARPEVIVRPIGPADVATAIRFAAAEHLPVSVRGGGHSVAGNAIGEASVMIDLRMLREVEVDPDARTVRVGGGCCWNDVDARTQSYGMAMPGGTYGDTGVAGLALTGGIGHLMGMYGLSLDNLLAVELVTAASAVLEVDAASEPDLFWALRGGGGNFGVVTTFTFRIHEVPMMTGGILVHRLEDATAVLRAFAELRSTIPPELTVMPAIGGAEGRADDEVVVLTTVAYHGTGPAADEAIAPLRSPAPVVDDIAHLHYSQVQSLYAYMPFGLRHYWTSRFTEEFPDDLIDFLVDHHASGPHGNHNTLLFEPLHGAAAAVPEDATAFASRRARFNVSGIAVWEDPALDAEEIAWAGAVRDRLEPLAVGGYLNYATDPTDVAGAFGGGHLERLRAVKRAWDPDNLFRFNHNIAPADDAAAEPSHPVR